MTAARRWAIGCEDPSIAFLGSCEKGEERGGGLERRRWREEGGGRGRVPWHAPQMGGNLWQSVAISWHSMALIAGATVYLARAGGVARHHDDLEAIVGEEALVDKPGRLEVERVVGGRFVDGDLVLLDARDASHEHDMRDDARGDRVPPLVAQHHCHVGQRRVEHDRDLMALLARLREGGEDELVTAALVELRLGREVGHVRELVVVDLLVGLAAVAPLGHAHIVSAERVERPLGQPRAHVIVAEVGDDRHLADQAGAPHDRRHDERLLVVLARSGAIVRDQETSGEIRGDQRGFSSSQRSGARQGRPARWQADGHQMGRPEEAITPRRPPPAPVRVVLAKSPIISM